jgi:hypothetical protein
MPILVVYGIPSDATQKKLESFCGSLIKAVYTIPELELKPGDISVFFPGDLMHSGLGEEIIIFVEGLFEKPERTEDVRQRLAKDLIAVAYKYFSSSNLIECLVRPFNPKSGFAYHFQPKKK